MEYPKFKSKIDKAKQKEWSQCKWVIMELQPFSAVEKTSFRNMMKIHDPQYKPIPNKTVKDLAYKKEKEIQAKLWNKQRDKLLF